MLRAGADKVSLNTAAVADPELVTRCAARFGRQAVVVAIDARASARPIRRSRPGSRSSSTAAGSPTGLDAVAWAVRAVELGAGELLVTSIDRDGTKSGFDTELLRAITSRVPVPVIASGGAAGPDDFVAAVRDGGADAVLAASIFHRPSTRSPRSRPPWPPPGCPVRTVTTGDRRMTPATTPGRWTSPPAWILPPSAGTPAGLVVGVVQDVADGRVLMVAWLDVEALAATLGTGEVHFHSRSRGRLWRKGETCGHVLRLRGLALDCDGDALLDRGRAAGPTCHRDTRSCFDPDAVSTAVAGALPVGIPSPAGPSQGFAWLESLWATIADRAATRARGLVHGDAARRRRGPRRPQGRRGGDRGAARGEERRGGRGAGTDRRRRRGSCSPARRATSCTTRWCCSPSAAWSRAPSWTSCGSVTVTSPRPEAAPQPGVDPHDRPVPLADPDLEPLPGDRPPARRGRVRDPVAVHGDRAALDEPPRLAARRREAGLGEQHDGAGRGDARASPSTRPWPRTPRPGAPGR